MAAKIIHQVRTASLFVLAAFPLLMPHWISLAAIFFLVSTLAIVIAEKDYRFDLKLFLVMLLPFLVYLAGLFLSDHLAEGIMVVQRKLLIPALALGFAFHHTYIDEKLRSRLFLTFEVAAVLIAIYTNLMIRFAGLSTQDPTNTDFTYLYRLSVENYSNLHPTYYCAILFWAAFLSINNLVRDWKKRNQNRIVWLELAFSVLLITSALAAASRAPMIAFGLVLFMWMVMKFRNAGKTWIAFVVLLVFAGSLLTLPSIRNRLLEMNVQNMKAPSQGNDNGTNVRSGIYLCNIELFKEHWLTGMGTGDVQPALNECYTKYETDIYEHHDYNSHNEYLNAWLTLGLPGIILFAATLVFSFVQALRRKHAIHLFFLVYICICFFTENYLERQSGVMLFAWFQCLFFFTEKRKEKPAEAHRQ